MDKMPRPRHGTHGSNPNSDHADHNACHARSACAHHLLSNIKHNRPCAHKALAIASSPFRFHPMLVAVAGEARISTCADRGLGDVTPSAAFIRWPGKITMYSSAM